MCQVIGLTNHPLYSVPPNTSNHNLCLNSFRPFSRTSCSYGYAKSVLDYLLILFINGGKVATQSDEPTSLQLYRDL